MLRCAGLLRWPATALPHEASSSCKIQLQSFMSVFQHGCSNLRSTDLSPSNLHYPVPHVILSFMTLLSTDNRECIWTTSGLCNPAQYDSTPILLLTRICCGVYPCRSESLMVRATCTRREPATVLVLRCTEATYKASVAVRQPPFCHFNLTLGLVVPVCAGMCTWMGCAVRSPQPTPSSFASCLGRQGS